MATAAKLAATAVLTQLLSRALSLSGCNSLDQHLLWWFFGIRFVHFLLIYRIWWFRATAAALVHLPMHCETFPSSLDVSYRLWGRQPDIFFVVSKSSSNIQRSASHSCDTNLDLILRSISRYCLFDIWIDKYKNVENTWYARTQWMAKLSLRQFVGVSEVRR